MLSAPSEADHAAAFRANAVGTFNVLEAARTHGVSQVLYASTINTYGHDLPEDGVDDYTLQRPAMFYGTTKLFGEHMGRFYRRKFGLDFRGIRYPSIVGPGVTTPGISQYTSHAIEASARNEPYTIFVEPRTRVPIIYIREAAEAIVKLAAAPTDRIQTVVYLLAGTTPTPTAQQLADAIRARLPNANARLPPRPRHPNHPRRPPRPSLHRRHQRPPRMELAPDLRPRPHRRRDSQRASRLRGRRRRKPPLPRRERAGVRVTASASTLSHVRRATRTTLSRASPTRTDLPQALRSARSAGRSGSRRSGRAPTPWRR